MSQENVEIVQNLFAEYASSGAGPASALLSPSVVWNAADEAPQHGRDAAKAYMDRWESEWEGLETTPEEFADAGDRVLVTTHFLGRGRASGIEIDTRLYEVFTLHNGDVIRMDEFTDRAEALEAAGLSE